MQSSQRAVFEAEDPLLPIQTRADLRAAAVAPRRDRTRSKRYDRFRNVKAGQLGKPHFRSQCGLSNTIEPCTEEAYHRCFVRRFPDLSANGGAPVEVLKKRDMYLEARDSRDDRVSAQRWIMSGTKEFDRRTKSWRSGRVVDSPVLEECDSRGWEYDNEHAWDDYFDGEYEDGHFADSGDVPLVSLGDYFKHDGMAEAAWLESPDAFDEEVWTVVSGCESDDDIWSLSSFDGGEDENR